MPVATRPRSLLLGGALLIAAILVVWQIYRSSAPPAQEPAQIPANTAQGAVLPAPRAAGEPEPAEYPLPAPTPDLTLVEVPEQPLPPLDDSDAPAASELEAIIGNAEVTQWLNRDDFVSRFVATVTSLGESGGVLANIRVAKPIAGAFAVTRSDTAITIAPDNAARYRPYVDAFNAMNTTQMVALYRRYYPLLQEAYAQLGYPHAHFNDRLVRVIDLLLATPEPEGPIVLVQPKVMFRYADPKLEALSAGQKVLIRMGNDNGRIVKQKLREIRAAITGQRG